MEKSREMQSPQVCQRSHRSVSARFLPVRRTREKVVPNFSSLWLKDFESVQFLQVFHHIPVMPACSRSPGGCSWRPQEAGSRLKGCRCRSAEGVTVSNDLSNTVAPLQEWRQPRGTPPYHPTRHCLYKVM